MQLETFLNAGVSWGTGSIPVGALRLRSFGSEPESEFGISVALNVQDPIVQGTLVWVPTLIPSSPWVVSCLALAAVSIQMRCRNEWFVMTVPAPRAS